MGHQSREGNGGLKRQPLEKGETASRRFKLGRLQRRILGFILQSGLRTFKPSMIPVHHNGKEVAEALARLAYHGIVRRLSHGYYAADLDKIKQLSVSRKLEFPPIQQIPPIRGLVPHAPPAQPANAQSTTKLRPTTHSTSHQPSPTSTNSKKSSKLSNPIPHNSVACRDKKLSKHIDCSRRRGVVINCSRLGAAPLQEILYDNVRAKTPQGYHYGDKGRLLRAEDLARFFATTRTGIDHHAIDHAELTVPTFSDYLEEEGVVKIYYKCIMVDDCELCSEFVEWMPPKGYIKRYGIARANYHFRKYILPAALKVIQRAIDILSRRLN